eukprot:jgi/Ulvmu1/11972/UM082_0051.1
MSIGVMLHRQGSLSRVLRAFGALALSSLLRRATAYMQNPLVPACAWLPDSGNMCMATTLGPDGLALAQVFAQLRSCDGWKPSRNMPCAPEHPAFCRDVPVSAGKGAPLVCAPGCARDHLSLASLFEPEAHHDHLFRLLRNSSSAADEMRTISVLELACDPRAAVAAAAAAGLAPACAGAKTRAQCRGAAGPNGFRVLSSDDLWPAAAGPAAADSAAAPADAGGAAGGMHAPDYVYGYEDGNGGIDDLYQDAYGEMGGMHARVPVAAGHAHVPVCDRSDTAAAAAAGVRCEWQRFMPGDVGECRATVAAAGSGGGSALLAVDRDAATCLANNAPRNDTDSLVGCVEDRPECVSWELPEDAGSFACVPAAAADQATFMYWLLRLLECAHDVRQGFEAYCGWIRYLFYSNLGRVDVAAAANAAAPYQCLCTYATTRKACSAADRIINR